MRTYKESIKRSRREICSHHVRTVLDVLPKAQGLLNLRGVRQFTVF